ncbi:phosphoadenosine phosphosulfate reductase family protein [Mucilaginibacter corticis]|uniref:Phosphoadenosine phosphosulfate reductase family protein n=1 Tax=Mucilaginibacter corticis TaxID=2597670 RepID=A0A556M9K1_9SPHI|nr:phosphoadenosine phosphosulfate reductase family protein [Mucilaginibacter corticis]TSJ36589.1 phosphoadenosine phosphosulfate reductase family protein [Mucilaginibacter corticis]
MNQNGFRHILSLSGGKDSAALAIYLRDRIPDMEYVFHDTGKELPETYEYLGRLEAILGKEIHKSTVENGDFIGFDQLLKVYGGMLPSSHRRWCTRMMKLRPFERFIGSGKCYNYVGLRADEDRTGYISSKPNIIPIYPFKEDGLVRGDIVNILEESGLGMPPYTEWGRTRSGCFFCFYQQKIEWVRLKETYPDLFEQAKAYEKPGKKATTTFYWCGNEPLAELEKPERMEQIKREHELVKARKKANSANKSLMNILGGVDDYESNEGCLICQL